MKHIFSTFLIIIMVFGLSACGLKKQEQYAGVDGDFINGTPLPDRVEGTNFFGGNVQRGQYSPIYFAFDSFSIHGDELTKVQQMAKSMRHSSDTFIIAGFTDDRGTQEYNRALGERRANAVRQALIRLGVNSNRLQTVSFGMEMPADPGTSEAARAKNRRSEFGVVRGR